MMAKFFFFTDPATLDPQTPYQAYGPVVAGDPAAEPSKDKFRITSVHSGTNAPAVAVCDGVVCVQEDENGTLSLILKPDDQPPFDFPYIEYFVYKGITKGSGEIRKCAI